jgi:PncC family amidohydrolase
MSLSAKKKAGTSFAIAITGIAGPSGGSKEKPIGLVYISIASDNNCDTKRFIFSHDRDFIRLRTVQTALNMLRLKLSD